MSEDIVTTLRAAGNDPHNQNDPQYWLGKPVDEIELLRSKLKALELISQDMATEIERLRAENKRMRSAIAAAFLNVDGEEVEPHVAILDMAKDLARAQFNIQRVDALAASLEATHANLTEALRLMEPVAEAETATQWPEAVCIDRDDARAIAAFAERMRGG